MKTMMMVNDGDSGDAGSGIGGVPDLVLEIIIPSIP